MLIHRVLVVFGSVARKEETPESDLDLCCVVRTGSRKESVRGTLERESASLHDKFGIKLSPLLLINGVRGLIIKGSSDLDRP